MLSATAVAEQEDRAEWHLWNWSVWHRRRTSKGGYPSRGMGGLGCSGSSDFDAMCATSDARCALAVDVMIDDLVPRQRAAVYNEWIADVFEFRGDHQAIYEQAKDKIARGLRTKGIW